MRLDPDICYRAMTRRDPRFDGRFFTAVRTTGIYCRPICPARTPKRMNCVFLPSAAAAERAGFRACRRCRPESAPGSPARLGVGATLARALRLIEAGALDSGSVETLSARLGITGRHLRRLFTEHLAASPKAVAQTHRLHLARRLVETTPLPMTAVATAAGFNSLRRFNDAFVRCFDQPPGALRRTQTVQEGTLPPAHGLAMDLALATRAPYDLDHLLAFLATRAIPGVEGADGGSYSRALHCAGGPAVIRVTAHPDQPGVMAHIRLDKASDLREAIVQIRHIFDLDTDSEAIDDALSQDPFLGPQIAMRPGVRIPGGPNPFEFTVRAVIGQQISVKGARTIAGRLVARAGQPLPAALIDEDHGVTCLFPTPAGLADADLDGLGLTTRRVATLKAVADAFLANETGLPDLTSLPGIGPWTADYVAMRALSEPDAFPEKDLGLLKALNLKATTQDARMLNARAELWRPYRAYAAIRLWLSLEE